MYRVAIICDLLEENWPSMDLVADMLYEGIRRDHFGLVSAVRIRPAMQRRLTRLRFFAGLGSASKFTALNFDRLVNRFWDYPRLMRRSKGDFDLFHVVDHSYGQLVHSLPPDRVVVTCHDLEAFSCLIGLGRRRSVLFRAMARRILDGVGKAARVVCDSLATRDELLANQLVDADRLAVVPLGVDPVCNPGSDSRFDEEASALLGPSRPDSIDILHIGSTVRRKRIDVLLKVFALVREEFRGARLIRVGGRFTPDQERLVKGLDLEGSILVLPFLSKGVLAAVCRRAVLLLQTSEYEGFGLPVVEAMACGTPVVASDLPALREVGGEAVFYCPVGDVAAWRDEVVRLLNEKLQCPDRWRAYVAAAIAQAGKFSWAEYARKMVAIYKEVLEG
jgi:glycosyltransferase involved in cell wall biosynthesis